MATDRHLQEENQKLRAQLVGLTDAILRINEDLELDTVLQKVVEGARALTDARYGAITTIDESGELQDLQISGLSDEQYQFLMTLPQGVALFEHLSGLTTPLRTSNFVEHVKSAGFPVFLPTIGAFLGTQIRIRDKHVGNIYIGEKTNGSEFTTTDEETLEMFATQAAIAITNARRYGREQRAKADLEALVNTSPVGVLVVDAQTREVVTANQEARRILGGLGLDMTVEDLGRQLSGLSMRRLNGTDIPAEERPIERTLRNGERARAEEVVIVTGPDDYVTTLINTTPIWSEAGELVTVIATMQDITPLEEIERLRTEFLGMVSHELRIPLTSIKGSAATALGATALMDSSEVRQFFRIIEEQADHMRGLINNLLDLTRIEAGVLAVNPEPISSTAVIADARNEFLSGGYPNSIELEVAPDLPAIDADRQRIHQVLFNLLTNASQHSPEWAPIRIAASFAEPYVTISVSDAGSGIQSDQLPHLFSKFSRLPTDRSTRTAGYGLGLAICRGIVEAHGGRIWADSEGLGMGSMFSFTIPVAALATDPTDQALQDVWSDVATTEQEPHAAESILTIDDDPQILRFIRTTLADAGYAPILCSEPEEAIGLIDAHQPRLVLLNLVLPRIDGFGLMERIFDASDLPVIVLSGRSRGEDIARAFDLGAADYVVKPFSPPELVARVRAALKKRAVLEQAQALEPFIYAGLRIDFMQRQVTMNEQPVPLTQTEYKLLAELAANAPRTQTHDDLLRRVWGEVSHGNQRILRSFIKILRRKLGDDARRPRYIFTESGVGYSMARAHADDQ